jgi:gamma-glutamyltranspeptidase/glutathione hydrolase
MIATPHGLATAAGRDVLRRGGNAVDAAIAANAVLCVVYPASCGLGGDALWLVNDPRAARTIAYNGSGRTPRAAARERLPGGVVPQRGALSVTVPGAVRSWEDVLRAHGTRALDELLAEAETYARDGFAVGDVVAAYLEAFAPLLRADAAAMRIFLAGGVPRAGDVLRNPDLADTLAAIRAGGADAFYRGRIAECIVRSLQAGGNAMALDDLAAHRTDTTVPLPLAWHGGEVLVHPPNSQGACLSLGLGMLREDGAADESLWNHLAIEAMKRAFAIRDATFCDPAFHTSGIEARLTPEALRALRATIDPDRAQPVATGTDRGGTIAVCVVDADGMAVCLIESLFMSFGSGIVADGTGVVLHNRGSFFAADPASPNAFEPAKRPLHTLAPAMMLRDGLPAIVFGTMGGNAQPQIQLQFLHHLLERKLDVQEAIDAPRWSYGRHLIPGRPELALEPTVFLESRFDPAIVADLERRGQRISFGGPYENALGHLQAIVIDRAAGTLAGGADPRADSVALGL